MFGDKTACLNMRMQSHYYNPVNLVFYDWLRLLKIIMADMAYLLAMYGMEKNLFIFIVHLTDTK